MFLLIAVYNVQYKILKKTFYYATQKSLSTQHSLSVYKSALQEQERRKKVHQGMCRSSIIHSAIFLTAEVNAGMVERCGSCNFLCFPVLLRGSK